MFRASDQDGGFPPWESLQLHDIRGKTGALSLERSGLTEYSLADSMPETGFYYFRVTADDSGEEPYEKKHLFVPPPLEELPYDGNWSLLDRLVKATGGQWLPEVSAIIGTKKAPSPGSDAIFVFCIAAGLVILLVETTARYYLRR